MITRVKMAPLERWCEPTQQAVTRLNRGKGQIAFAYIDTLSMRQCETPPVCDGREWRVVRFEPQVTNWDIESGEVVLPTEESWMCEHMLVMD